jgi:hypothetical protein
MGLEKFLAAFLVECKKDFLKCFRRGEKDMLTIIVNVLFYI